MSLRRIVDRLLVATGFADRARRKNADRLAIFMFHGVVERELTPFCWHQLPVGAFREQLQWIKANYAVMSLDDGLAKMREGDLPTGAAAITFDDGYLNNKTVAWPVLQELDLPATIFLVTEAVGGTQPLWPDRVHLAVAGTSASEVDLSALGLGVVALNSTEAKGAAIDRILDALKRTPHAERDGKIDALVDALDPQGADAAAFRLLDWDDIHEMAADPRITFGAHTLTHPILSRLEDAEVVRQVGHSQAAVAEALGTTPQVFAYPNGRSIDFDERAKAAVKEAGMDYALATESGFASADSDPLALPRVCVGSDLTFDRFRLVASGAWPLT